MSKTYTDIDVLSAAQRRMRIVFENFDSVYVAFSGGKDSGVLLHLALEEAERRGRLPVDVLFIDLEAQYTHTVAHMTRMMSDPRVRPHWVCLPLRLRNAVSQIQPHWLCWDPSCRDAWVRDLPTAPGVVSDPAFFPFFRPGMEFEEFFPAFGEWLSRGRRIACLVGIRADESLNRYRTLRNTAKETFEGHMWSTRRSEHVYNFYPLYDWQVEDVWAANGRKNWPYNRIYDLMHLAGVSVHKMRLCQPYGDDQRKSIYLYKILEPETWARIVGRVEGANFGNRYAGGTVLGNYRVALPPGHTHKSYAKFLLATMPPYMARHYRRRIFKFLLGWRKNGKAFGCAAIPDSADPKLEAKKAVPSWRRICKVLLKNDYWCRGLSFSQTKREAERQLDLVTRYMEF